MAAKMKAVPNIEPSKIDAKDSKSKQVLSKNKISIEERLEQLESLPRRNPILHWVAFLLSLFSLIILAIWVFSSRGPVPNVWIIADIGLGVVLAIEFFTRSGFRWDGVTYFRTRFFDFVAIIPALALVHNGYIWEGVWVWIILAARATRMVDRLLGDGFVNRNSLALIEGLEEEITDRVLERIVVRIQADMDQADFSHGIAEALARNKDSVLGRIRAATPHEGFVPGLARMVHLDAALERAEERTFDAVVGIIDSKEVDHAVKDVVSSLFSRMRTELGERSWRKHLGIHH